MDELYSTVAKDLQSGSISVKEASKLIVDKGNVSTYTYIHSLLVTGIFFKQIEKRNQMHKLKN